MLTKLGLLYTRIQPNVDSRYYKHLNHAANLVILFNDCVLKGLSLLPGLAAKDTQPKGPGSDSCKDSFFCGHDTAA